MAKYLVEDTSLISVADAIREKTGGGNSLSFPDGFISEIEGIASNGDITKTIYAEAITFSSDTKTVTLNHNLGLVPNIVVYNGYTATGTGAAYRIVSFIMECGATYSNIYNVGSSNISGRLINLSSYSEFPSDGYIGQPYYVQIGYADTKSITVSVGETSSLKFGKGITGIFMVGYV